jgi:hypothetical protein
MIGDFIGSREKKGEDYSPCEACDDLKTALSREGQTLATYRVSVKAEMEKAEIIDRQVRRKVSITDEDVERYYKQNPNKFRGDERAHIRHILLSLAETAPDAGRLIPTLGTRPMGAPTDTIPRSLATSRPAVTRAGPSTVIVTACRTVSPASSS